MKKLLLHAIAFWVITGFCLVQESRAGQQDEEIVEVENLLELRAKEPGGNTVYKLTGEAILTFQQNYRNQKFIQDETAGILIDDNARVITSIYKINDGITGITGKLGVFNNNLQFIPTEDPGPASSTGNEPVAVQRTLAEITPGDQGRLVVIEDLSFDESLHGESFKTGQNYVISDASGPGVFRTEFWDADYIGTAIPAEPHTITALVILYRETIQIVSRSLSDLQVTDIPNIRALRNQVVDNETVYHLTGEALLGFQQSNRNKKWIHDETAGIEIDDPTGIITTIYEIGDGITGIRGKLGYNRRMLQFIPVEDPGEATSKDNELIVIERTLADLTSDDQGRLALIKDVVFDASYHGTNFANGQNMNVEDPTGPGVFRTHFFNVDYIGTPVPTIPQNLTVIVHQFEATIQITARSLEDFEAVGEEPRFTLSFVIMDEDGETLQGAVISLQGEAYEAGQYVIEDLLPGTYAFDVSLEGYHSFSGEVLLGTEDKEVEVVLIAIDPELVDEFPWTEGFEESFPPAGWVQYDASGAEQAGSWQTHPTANTGSLAAHHRFSFGTSDSWLVTPQVQLPEEETMLMTFFERNASMNDYTYSGVWISTASGNPLNGSFEELRESSASAGTYVERTLNLADYKGKVVYFAFVYQGENGHDWWIDDVKIEQAPDVIEVPDIATLREVGTTDGTVFRVTGPVVLTHQNTNRNQKHFQDATGAILIDDRPAGTSHPDVGIITTAYEEYDAIVGLTGTLSLYNQLLQMIPTEDPGPAVSHNNVIEPLEVTLAGLMPQHQSMLVIIKGVTIDIPAGETNFATSKNYTVHDASGSGILRTPHNQAALDYFGTPIPTTPKDLIAVVGQFNADMQIAPRSLADFIEPGSTNVPEVADKESIMYPNPARTFVHIISQRKIDSIRIFDMSGRVVQTERVDGTQVTISTASLKNGLYILQLLSSSHVESHRLQVSH